MATIEVQRLRGAAWVLKQQAGNVEHAANRLRGRVEQPIAGGRWKGPSAERHWRGMQDRHSRLMDAVGRMRRVASQLDSRANHLEAEERRRKAAVAAAAR